MSLDSETLGVSASGPSACTPSSASPAPWWLRTLIPVVIVAATFAAFWPALDNELLEWDDNLNLTENDAYRGLGWQQLRWMFTTFHGGHYQPLSWITLSLDYSVWGLDARGFHLTNLILHAANAVLFYFLVRRLVALAMPRAVRDAAATGLVGAGLAALLFAVHPLRVESVAWATERRDVLSGFFWLLTLLAYLRARTRPEAGSLRWVGVSVLCLALALLSKVMAATLPVVLVVLDVYPLRRLHTGHWFSRDVRSVWLEKLPFFLLAAAVACIAPLAQVNVESMRTLEQYGLAPRLTQTLYGFAFYLQKTLLPTGLSPLYELPPTVGLWEAPYLVSALVVAAITVSLVVVRRRWPAGLAAWVCYCVILFPVSGILQNGPQITADRYSYVACMGWAALAGAGFILLRRRGPLHARGVSLFLPAVVAATVSVAALGLLTRRQTALWHDSMTLWSQALAVEPDSAVGNNLVGKALAAQGKLDRAIEHYKRSLATNPAHVQALYNWANALLRKNRLNRAITLYRRVLQLDPSYVPAWNNLAGTLLKLDRHQEGINTLREALAKAPNDLDLTRNLAWVLATCPRAELRDGPAAVRLAERASVLTDYRDARCLRTLAAAYAEAGRFEDAARAARRAERLPAPD